MKCIIMVQFILATGIKIFPVTGKKELHLKVINNHQMIEKGVYKICESELEKIHQEIRIRVTMDYIEEVYESEISDDRDEESDEESDKQ